jgi:hypothetical protein
VYALHSLMELEAPACVNVTSGYERNCPRSQARFPKPPDHREVGVEPNALQPANAKRSEAVVVLQAPELPLDGEPSLTHSSRRPIHRLWRSSASWRFFSSFTDCLRG